MKLIEFNFSDQHSFQEFLHFNLLQVINHVELKESHCFLTVDIVFFSLNYHNDIVVRWNISKSHSSIMVLRSGWST